MIRVAIRTDAAAAIGLGHLQRCLALAHALRADGAEVAFVTRNLGFDSASRVTAAGYAVEELPAPAEPLAPVVLSHAAWAGVAWEQDAAESAAAMAGKQATDWIVVDHYALDAHWHEAVAARVNARIIVIDDVADRRLACSVLVDHNFSADHRRKYAGCVQPNTTILGGPQYALLGPAYSTAPRYECRDVVQSLGIFMGGLDAGGHSVTALRSCREAGFAGAIEIAASSGNPRLDALKAAVRQDANAKLSVDLPDLSSFFARHDLQIGAGGGATWERCCIGAPTLAAVVAENQRPVLEPLRDLGVLRMIEPTQAAIAAEVRGLVGDPQARRGLARRAAELVDGRGAARVSRYMLAA